MSQRITIMLNDKIVKALRKIQADEITKSDKYISFSYIINKYLAKSTGVKIEK